MKDPTRRYVLGTAVVTALSPWARAAATYRDASELAEAVFARPTGRDLSTRTRMDLQEPGRPVRTRRLATYRLSRGPGETTHLMRFLEPRDIAGVGLLSQMRPDGSADQMLYLPELKRSRKVANDRKGGRFVGSDLYFEDLRDRLPRLDQHRMAGKETVSGVSCELLESTPVDPDESVYLKRISWIDRERLIPLRVDYFEQDQAAPTKRWVAERVDTIQGFWTIAHSAMVDLRQGTATHMTIESARYDRRLPARLFTPQALADETLEAEYRL